MTMTCTFIPFNRTTSQTNSIFLTPSTPCFPFAVCRTTPSRSITSPSMTTAPAKSNHHRNRFIPILRSAFVSLSNLSIIIALCHRHQPFPFRIVPFSVDYYYYCPSILSTPLLSNANFFSSSSLFAHSPIHSPCPFSLCLLPPLRFFVIPCSTIINPRQIPCPINRPSQSHNSPPHRSPYKLKRSSPGPVHTHHTVYIYDVRMGPNSSHPRPYTSQNHSSDI